MITEIEVTHEGQNYLLEVIFRVASQNDGGQSDLVSPPEFYVDGALVGNDALNWFGDVNIALLNDMYNNYQNYKHSIKEIKEESEYD